MTLYRQFLRFRPASFRALTAGATLSALVFTSALLTGCDDGALAGGSGGGPLASGGSVVGSGGAASSGGAANAGGAGPGVGGTAPSSGGSDAEPVNSACGSADAPFKLYADEKNNIKIHSTVGLPTTPMKKSDPDVTFDWSAINTDMFGNPMTPADITHAVLVVWLNTITIDGIAEGISTDSPTLEGNALIAIYLPTGGTKTSGKLTEFLLPGQEPLPMDQLGSYIDGSKSLTLMLQYNPQVTGDGQPNFGYSVKMIQGFSLEDTGPTTVNLTNDSTEITATPDLASVENTLVPAGSNNISIDWTDTITTRGYGTDLPWIDNQIAEVVVARYAAETDLSTQFTRLEGIPLDLWRVKVPAGSSALLNDSTMVNEKNPGTAFMGVPPGSTDQYLLMLLCPKDKCRNPTPWYISPLKACP